MPKEICRWSVKAANASIVYKNENFDIKDFNSKAANLSGSFGTKKITKYKNMYVLLTGEKMKKKILYDEYFVARDYDSQYSTYNIGDIVKYDENIYECIEKVSSVQPFDINKWENLDNEFRKIYLLQGTDLYKSLERTHYSNDYDYWRDYVKIIDTSKEISDIFKQGQNYIEVDLSQYTDEQLNEAKSIQYWYENGGSLKMVFGVNLTDMTEEEIANKKIKIYTSLLSLRDKRVYDDNKRIVGLQANILGDEDEIYSPTSQQYSTGKPFKFKVQVTKEINNDLGSILIYRESSLEENVPVGTYLTDDDEVYLNDVLKISVEMPLAYSIDEIIVNGNNFINNDRLTVLGDISILASISLYKLYITTDIDEGAVLTMERTASPYGGASLGEVTTSDIFYYNDIVQLTTEAEEGYVIDEVLVNGLHSYSNAEITIYDNTSIRVIAAERGNKTLWEGRWEYNFLENDGLNTETIFDLTEILGEEIDLRQRPVIITFADVEVSYGNNILNANGIAGGGNRNDFVHSSTEGPLWASSYLSGGEFVDSEPYMTFDRYISSDSTIESTSYLKFVRTLGSYKTDETYQQCMFSRMVITKIEQQY